jgi:hypothetical protein
MMGQYVTVHGEVISHVNITRSAVEDGGLYTCTAVNRAGSASHSARLNVYGSPMVHPIPEIKAVVGRSVHIICPASGYPLDKIAWSKGENELSSGGRLSVFPNGSLVLTSVSSGDAGGYTCTATNRSTSDLLERKMETRTNVHVCLSTEGGSRLPGLPV